MQAAALCAPLAPNDAEEFLTEQMGLVPRTLVEYCSVAAPETRESLQHELRKFNARLGVASSPVLDRLRSEGAFSAALPAEARASLDEVKQRMLNEIKKVEPLAYCTQFSAKLGSIDAQALVNAAEQSYLKYVVAAKERQVPAK
jgi:hypothetical protein